ncbi:MAG: hypothetical protein ACP6IS_11655 [Candidatus Asgardarchaeia archaeon]
MNPQKVISLITGLYEGASIKPNDAYLYYQALYQSKELQRKK